MQNFAEEFAEKFAGNFPQIRQTKEETSTHIRSAEPRSGSKNRGRLRQTL